MAAKALFLCATTALSLGCASLDQPERPPLPASAGLAPYRQVAAIEVCKGTARLVAAASAEQGTCRAEERSSKSCQADTDCAPREACVCGRCTVQLCQSTRECRQGLTCTGLPKRCTQRCTADQDCTVGSVCRDLVCTDPCSDSEQCPNGESCREGHCVVSACGPNGPGCRPPDKCDLQLERGLLHAPGVVIVGGVTVLYAELDRSGGAAEILRAESRDGLRFEATPAEPVIVPAAEQLRVGAPSPMLTSDGFVLFYAVDDGAGIARATSGDGIRFDAGGIVLSPASAWENGAVRAPGAVRVGSQDLLFYEGGDGAGIGLAVSTNGSAFERVSDAPLFAVGDVGNSHWIDIERVGAPEAVAVTDVLGERALRVFFSATGREDTAPQSQDGGAPPLNASIGLAAAPLDSAFDFTELALYRDNPVLAGLLPDRRIVPETAPSITLVGQEWRMYFDGEGGIWLAANPPR